MDSRDEVAAVRSRSGPEGNLGSQSECAAGGSVNMRKNTILIILGQNYEHYARHGVVYGKSSKLSVLGFCLDNPLCNGTEHGNWLWPARCSISVLSFSHVMPSLSVKKSPNFT